MRRTFQMSLQFSWVCHKPLLRRWRAKHQILHKRLYLPYKQHQAEGACSEPSSESRGMLCIISPSPFSHTHLFCCFRYFRYLRHSVIPFMFRPVYVPSCQLSYLHYLSPLGSGRILHGSCYVLIVHNIFTFLSFILLLSHYSVHLRYCYLSPYISVIVLWHQYPKGYWYPRPSLLFRSVYKPDKLVVVLQFVINLISLTLFYSKPLCLLKVSIILLFSIFSKFTPSFRNVSRYSVPQTSVPP
jgi:hypothetical protein